MSVHYWLEVQGMNALTCGFECVWWCVGWHVPSSVTSHPCGLPRPLKEGLESETDPLGVFGPLFISHTTIGDTRNSQDALWKQSVNSFTKCSWANVVIIFNYAFHNLAPYIYQGCLFHTQSWYYHLLPTNLFTCGIYKQVFLRIPQVFLRLCLHLFETCFWHQTTCPPV